MLGILAGRNIEVDDDIPKEALSVLSDYLAGIVDTEEFATAMGSIRLKAIPESVPTPER